VKNKSNKSSKRRFPYIYPGIQVAASVKLLLLNHWISSISTSLGLENKITHSLHGLRYTPQPQKQKTTIQNSVTNRCARINKKHHKL
jgi:hypothetical protein